MREALETNTVRLEPKSGTKEAARDFALQQANEWFPATDGWEGVDIQITFDDDTYFYSEGVDKWTADITITASRWRG